MSRIQRFEDLIAWQKARLLTKEIYKITKTGDFAKDFGLSSQIQRAAVSVMSNIAEGFERRSRADFHKFLLQAKASCAEVRCQLYVALDVGYVDRLTFDSTLRLAEEVGRVVGGLRATVEQQRDDDRIKV